MYIFFTLLTIIAILCAALLIRTITLKPYPAPGSIPGEVDVPKEKAASDFVAILQCKTVSHNDVSKTDQAEFDKFYEVLKERYPLVHANCTLEKIGPFGLLYHWKGNRSNGTLENSGDPVVFMSHFDVVPADEEHWEKPPFAGIIEDGIVWGRGTIDTKITLCGVLNAAEYLLEKGFVPATDFYFSFGGDEETHGASCIEIVSWFEEKGIRPRMVIDEGGIILEGIFPGISAPSALIGIGEKGVLDLECYLESSGGHASTPPPHTLVGELAKAVTRIEKHPFPARLTKPVAEMYDTLSRHTTFKYRLVFANLWFFLPFLKCYARLKGGNINAMLRTTCAVTRMEGSSAFNVLPTKACVGMNMRLLNGTTVDSAVSYIKRKVKNDDIKFHIVNGGEAAIPSDTTCDEYEILQKIIHTIWPEALISPYLMVAATDSRHFLRITDRVYRFSPLKLTPEEKAMIHSHNERIPLESLYKVVEFYLRLIQAL